MLDFFILINLFVLIPIIIYGIIIAFLNKKNAKNLQAPSKWWIYTLCGFIGTPIHEFSHFIFNLIFLHKIKEVALYRPIKSKKDGILGYVNFSYNPSSLYQNIGLFFTGIGPMIGGCTVLYLLLRFLLPNVFSSLQFTYIDNLNFIDILTKLWDSMCNNFKCLFTQYENKQNFALFMVLAFSISTHMHISTEDLKTATKGFVIIEILLFIISILLVAFGLTFVNSFILICSSYVISFLTIGLIFSVISLGASYIIYLLP